MVEDRPSLPSDLDQLFHLDGVFHRQPLDPGRGRRKEKGREREKRGKREREESRRLPRADLDVVLVDLDVAVSFRTVCSVSREEREEGGEGGKRGKHPVAGPVRLSCRGGGG